MNRSRHFVSATQRLQDCLATIAQWEPQVNAMITVDEAGARQAAQAADQASAMGRSLGLLHGIPVVIKDNIDTSGLRTTYGSRFFAQHVPTADAEVVQRMRAAGAVIIGKATLHEFAFGTRSMNSVTGQCRNPWDVSRIPGGSSGGSAVALATQMADMALGSDTGASVRLPASFTGVSGLRPTFGSVSNRGSFPLSPSHDIIGPMARSAEEVALLYAVIAGYDPADPHSEDVELPNFLPRLRDPIAGLRIGRPRNHYFDNLSDAVGKAVEEAICTFEKLGAQIVDVDVPGASVVPDWYPIIMISDARDLHAERLRQGPSSWDPQTLDRMQVGARYTGADYAHALRKREQWCITLGQVFSEVDLLLSPTCPIVAPGIDDPRGLFEISKALTQNTVLGPFGRIPGLSVPCGISQEGLPIGLQLESARWNDALLLQAGVAFQSVTQWHEQRPQLKA